MTELLQQQEIEQLVQEKQLSLTCNTAGSGFRISKGPAQPIPVSQRNKYWQQTELVNYQKKEKQPESCFSYDRFIQLHWINQAL